MSVWAVQDLNLRRLLPTDLQSVPFGHLGNRPYITVQGVADDGNRTHNLPLTRRLLCRLSYVGKRRGKLYQKFWREGGVYSELTGESIGETELLSISSQIVTRFRPPDFE